MKIPAQSSPILRDDLNTAPLSESIFLKGESSIQPSACTNTCLWPVTGATGRAFRKSTARLFARIKWRSRVRIAAGKDFANWTCAINKTSDDCYKRAGLWRCRATGTPCKTS